MYKFKRWLFELCLKYIRYYNKDNVLVRHAVSEFDLTWKDWRKEEMQNLMCTQLLDLLYLLASQGDSGRSIGYKSSLLNKLMKFEPISRITFKDEDFGIDSFGGNTRQHKRLSSIFKEGEKITCLNLSKTPKYYIGEELEVIKKDKSYSMTGQSLVFLKDGNFKKIGHSLVIDPTKAFNNDKYNYPIYDVEYPKDWWISIVKEQDLPVLAEGLSYHLSDATEYLDREIYNFKEGIHKDEILKRVELVINHINK